MLRIKAVVKFNEGEAFIFNKIPELKYKRYYNIIIGTNGFEYKFYYYQKSSLGFQAFAGREFELKMSDGEIIKCNGQWWNGITSKAEKILKDIELVPITLSTKKELQYCYVYRGDHADKKIVNKIRNRYKGKIYEYYEYEKLIFTKKRNHKWN